MKAQIELEIEIGDEQLTLGDEACYVLGRVIVDVINGGEPDSILWDRDLSKKLTVRPAVPVTHLTITGLGKAPVDKLLELVQALHDAAIAKGGSGIKEVTVSVEEKK